MNDAVREDAEGLPPSWRDWHSEEEPIRLGISSCLLGEEVRFDGGHKRDAYLVDQLGCWVEWVPVCPELEIGMGIPRPTIRLEQREEGEVLVAPSTGRVFTEEMARYARERVGALQQVGLDGYVLKKSSPSCGMERVKVYGAKGPLHKKGVGHYARVLQERWPALPTEEEGRLNDPGLRENFVERIFARNRWRVLVRRGLSRKALVAFHTAHKMLLRAHDEAAYRRLGKLVAAFGSTPDQEIFTAYESEFQGALRTHATPKKHANVMQHILGYLKEHLDGRQKREILGAIEDFRQGLLPLVVPLTLLRFQVNTFDVGYVRGQLYLEPHPKELMLRNHV
jgi:uncharacterized protein YbgA (DUF1722 family)/uncharacterized protein YbbK (DUF523 family)